MIKGKPIQCSPDVSRMIFEYEIIQWCKSYSTLYPTKISWQLFIRMD
jgi:hypothetical protein